MNKMLIGADIVPTQRNIKYFESGDAEKLVGHELKVYLDSADYVILNLEAPYVDSDSPIIKAGGHMRGSTKAFEGIKKINPYFFGLANNHILDHGEGGLENTIKLLEENDIAYAGAGKNLSEAVKPYIADVNGTRVGIYACAEHEYSIAGENSFGANPYDPLYSFDHVRELRQNSDLVMVLFHGGKEYYRYPTPMLQKIFHKFADCGADIVISQHTHCIGCYEKYNNSTLVYGQGNFLFDDSNREEEKTSLLVEVSFNSEKFNVNYVPIVKCGPFVRLADEEQKKVVLDEFNKRSNSIADSKFVKTEFEKLAMKCRKNYMLGLAGGFSRILPVRVVCKIFGEKATDHFYGKSRSLAADNFINCETHRELVVQSLKYLRDK